MKKPNYPLRNKLTAVWAAVVAACLPASLPAQNHDPVTLAEMQNILRDPVRLAGMESARSTRAVATLNQLVYQHGESITLKIKYRSATDRGRAAPWVVLSASQSQDVEIVALRDTANPLERVMVSSVSGAISSTAGPGLNNGTLALRPAEMFFAFAGEALADVVAIDFGIAADSAGPGWNFDERVNMNPDDRRAKPVATIGLRGLPGVTEVMTDEILFWPKNADELDAVLRSTGATLRQRPRRSVGNNFLPGWHRIGLPTTRRHLDQLNLLRRWVGADRELVATDEAALKIFGAALELSLEGHEVSLNVVPQAHGPKDLAAPEHAGRDVLHDDTDLPRGFTDEPRFGLREMWSLMALIDADEKRVPFGVIDVGFASNADFRGHPTLLKERNMELNTSGPGTAQFPSSIPTQENKPWHGNGVVSTAAGVFGNNFGAAGTGGQVAQPMLYYMGLEATLHGMGEAIETATDDGAVVINISMGYPCRIHWLMSGSSGDQVCTEDGRAWFFAKMAAAAELAAAAACAASAAIPFIGPAICLAAIATAHEGLIIAAAALPIFLDKEPIKEGVKYAHDRGVIITASAGNRLGLPGAMVDLLDIPPDDEWTVEDWQIVPASLPGVICVGSVDNTSSYANNHLYGDRVDVWAPAGMRYFKPDGNSASGQQSRTSKSFGATSGASAFVSGVVMNMVAVNDDFDRREVPSGQRSQIAPNIRSLLKSTATPAGSLPGGSNPELARRRNLINPLAAVHAAHRANGNAPNFNNLGYTTDNGLADAVTNSEIDQTSHNLQTFTVRLDEVHAGDSDRMRLTFPNSSTTVYQARMEVRVPRNMGSIGGAGGPTSQFDGPEAFSQWDTGWYFGGPNEGFNVHFNAGQTSDTLYKFHRIGNMEEMPAPEPDEFETGRTNDTKPYATCLGDVAPYPWIGPLLGQNGFSLTEYYQILIKNLTIHAKNDVDWFKIAAPPAWMPSACNGDAPRLAIDFGEDAGAGLEFSVYTKNEVLIDQGKPGGDPDLFCPDYLNQFPLYVKMRYVGGAESLSYDLRIRWIKKGNDVNIPIWVQQFVPIWDQVTQPAFLDTSRVLGEEFFRAPLGLDFRRGQDGLVSDQKYFVIKIHTAGDFEVLAFATHGSGMENLRMELHSLRSLSPATPLAISGFDPQPEPPGSLQTLLMARSLQPGHYLLGLSGFGAGPVQLLLSPNAAAPGTPSLANWRMGTMPTPVYREGPAQDPAALAWDPDVLRGTSLQPVLRSAGQLDFTPGREPYRIEVSYGDGWVPYGDWTSARAPGEPATLIAPLLEPRGQLRVATQDGLLLPATLQPALEMQFATRVGVRYAVQRGGDLGRWTTSRTITGNGQPCREGFSSAASSRTFMRALENPQ